MRRDLEALLFATDQPLTLDRLASLFPDVDRKALREAIDGLRDEYERDGHAFTVVEFGGGWSISTRPEHAALVRRLYRGRRKTRLSKAALEVLAIIAYKQPVTRLEIEDIRGVSASGVLATLLERDLVSIVGRAESLGHPLLYGSTKAFLDYLGLKRIQDLPQLSELEDLLAEKEELKQLAARYGGELSEEELEEELAAKAAGAGAGDEADDDEGGEDPVSAEPADDATGEDEGTEPDQALEEAAAASPDERAH